MVMFGTSRDSRSTGDLKPRLTKRHGSRRTLRVLLTVRLIADRVKDVDVRTSS
jgi:hypothetical protein